MITRQDLRQDKLWKSIIEDFFIDMMQYFYPSFMQERKIREIIFLDKELDGIFSHTVQKDRRADKLVRVSFETGEQKYLLIHIEIQGYRDPLFGQRMFTYFYRIFDSVGPNIESLVIFTFPRTKGTPHFFEHKALETYLRFEFNAQEVWKEEATNLANSNNPFALILLTAKEAAKVSKNSDEQKMAFKLGLLKKLEKRGYSKVIRNKLFHFIINYLKFSKEESLLQFENILEGLVETNEQMGILELVREYKIASIKEQAMKEAKEIAMKEAKEQAMKEAKEIAMKEALRSKMKLVKNAFELKAFKNGSITLEEIANMVNLSLEEVEKIYTQKNTNN